MQNPLFPDYFIPDLEAELSLALVHKHVKISVDKWVLETTHPHKHVKKNWENI